MNNKLIAFFMAAGMTLVALSVLAQGPPPGTPQVPIDGGAGVLLAVGAAYGAKILYNQRGRTKDK